MIHDITKIIQMVEAGKITAEEGSQLIHALTEHEEKEEEIETDKTKKSLRLQVRQHDQVKINLRIPLSFVRFLLKVGKNIALAIPEAKQYITAEDFKTIQEAIEQQYEGAIIDAQTEEGEHVLITID